MLTVFSWKRLDKKRCSSLTSVSPQNSRQYLQLSRSTVRSLSVPQFYLFLLFPGQKAFISVSHPKQALPSVVLRQGFISIDLSNILLSAKPCFLHTERRDENLVVPVERLSTWPMSAWRWRGGWTGWTTVWSLMKTSRRYLLPIRSSRNGRISRNWGVRVCNLIISAFWRRSSVPFPIIQSLKTLRTTKAWTDLEFHSTNQRNFFCQLIWPKVYQNL